MLTLSECLRTNRPLIFCGCENEFEVLNFLNENHKNHFQVYTSTYAKFISLSDLIKKKFQDAGGKTYPIDEILDQVYNRTFAVRNNVFNTFIFLDVELDHQGIRKVKDILDKYQADFEYTVNLLFMNQTVVVPPELERYSEVVYFPLPDEAAIKEKSDVLCSKTQLDMKGDKAPTEDVLSNLKGMTIFEIEQAYSISSKLYNRIDLKFIQEYKKSSLAKTDLLSLLESNVAFEDIGGLSILKEWVTRSQGGWTAEGKKFGLPLLKGLLLVGPPGCGKSLSAKAVGNLWSLPVINFDPSRVFSSQVGSSEKNIRRVLKIIENVAPCLEGSARITLADGQVASIKELYENNFRGEVISINNDFKLDKSSVVLITKKSTEDLYNIRSLIGNIKATGNHKFPILKENGELHWVQVDNLKRGDFIMCPRQIKTNKKISLFDYFSEDTRFYSKVYNEKLKEILKEKDPEKYKKIGRRIRGSKPEFSPLYDGGKIPYGQGLNGYVLKKDITDYGLNDGDFSHVLKIVRGGGGYQDSSIEKFPDFDEEFFYIMGLFWSDGNIGDKSYWYYDEALKSGAKYDGYRTRNQNSTLFYGNEIILHKAVTEYIFKNFGAKVNTVEAPDRPGYFVTMQIPVIIGELFRKVQKDILSLDEKYQWAWLSGVLDGDGHIHKQRINYSATKHMNNEYIRDVFLRVGIPTTSCVDDFKNLNVEITSQKFIKKASDRLKVRYPKKVEGLHRFSETDVEEKCRIDTINVTELLKTVLIDKDKIMSMEPLSSRKQFLLDNSISVESRSVIHNYLENQRKIDMDKLKIVFKELGEDPWFFSDNFYFSEIEEISKIHGTHDVYDLCLDKNHNFIANRMFTHNCVLFIDEIEKAFAGSHSSTFSDAGVTSRVIMSFLIWMQECTAPVFTVATSNNIQYLPPELISRFDQTFFVNVPQHNERVDIFKIHFKKLKRDPEKFDCEALAANSVDFVGREIEQVLKDAMYEAFFMKKDLTTEIILNCLNKKTNVITTMAEQLNYLFKWVGWDPQKKDGIRARYAHPVEEDNRARIMDEISNLIKDVEKGGGSSRDQNPKF